MFELIVNEMNNHPFALVGRAAQKGLSKVFIAEAIRNANQVDEPMSEREFKKFLNNLINKESDQKDETP